jgi:propanol-preferring alcohol dehydrogenase
LPDAVVRALELVAPGRAELREVPDPEPGPGEVLLAVRGAGVCHSDLHMLHAKRVVFGLPLRLGHEVAGTVAAVGPQVSGWDVGAGALVHLCWGCGRCRACAAGAENYCDAYPRSTVPGPGLGHPGGMAERVVVPARHLVELGDLDPVQAAPLTDAGLTSFHALALSRDGTGPGSTVAVVGVGGLGHVALQMLRATTDARVVAVDTDERRLQQARELGADEALSAGADTAGELLALTAGAGVDVVLDFVGATPTVELAGAVVRSGGRVVTVGLAGGRLQQAAAPPPIGLPWGVSVVKPYGGSRRDLVQVVSLAAAGRLSVHVEPAPLDDALSVLDRLERGEVVGRAVLVP